MENLMKTKYPTKGMFLAVYDCDENRLLNRDSGVNFLTRIENFSLKKQINHLYNRIMNKPGDTNDGLEDVDHDDSLTLLNKS